MNSFLSGRDWVLASSSPRRRDLLRQVGVEPEIFPVSSRELAPGSLPPAELVEENARRKALAAWERLGPRDCWLLAADTVVVLFGRTLGKPAGPEEARTMLRLLQGEEHSVFTGQCLVDGLSGESLTRCRETRVRFLPLADEEIAAYVAGGEPLDKAGAYGVQGAAGLFVDSIRGDYSAVVGLCLPELKLMTDELSEKRSLK